MSNSKIEAARKLISQKRIKVKLTPYQFARLYKDVMGLTENETIEQTGFYVRDENE